MAETTIFMTPHVPAATKVEVRVQATLSETARDGLKIAVHNELLKRVDLQKLSAMQQDAVNGRQQILAVIHQIVSEQNIPLSSTDREQIDAEILNEIFGFGPIEPLLHDPTVSDILINGFDHVYVERRGLLEKTSIAFRDNSHLMHIIDKIVSAVGRRIDESSPMVDARLLDGSRVNVIIPPLAVDGPSMSIRRFGSSPMGVHDLLRNKAFTPAMLDVMQAAVQARLNIIVSGGTGAGKTTLLNVLSGFISPRERIVTIEDSAEMQIKREHVVRLETRPPNVEGRGAIKQRELLINALRMRPDRIILGETRGEEALDMLQAMNTGHDGSLTTVHANNPRDAISRVETMAMMGNIALPEKAIRAQIASAVDLIVQVSRMSDGSRRITHISEITGNSNDVLSMQDIFVFEKAGLSRDGKVKGRFRATGIVPKFSERTQAAGFPLQINFADSEVEV